MPSLWTGLVDVELGAESSDHALVGSVVVRDTDLPAVPRDRGLPLTVVVTGGAGQIAGPAGFCGRAGLRVASLAVALRDLDDPAGNARRVVAAVDAARADGSLDEDTPVHVELPASAPSYGWLAAADEIAGAELRLRFRPEGVPSPTLATWVDAALDRETSFTCADGTRFLELLLATGRAFDGAGADEVVAILDGRESAYGPDELARGRRWFTSFGSADVDRPLAELRARGLHP